MYSRHTQLLSLPVSPIENQPSEQEPLGNDTEHFDHADLGQTVDLPNSVAAPPDDSLFELHLPTASSDLHGVTKQFNESTRTLLRERLIIAAATTLALLVLLKLIGLLCGNATLFDLLTRLTGSIVLAGVAFYLYRTPNVSLQRLRWLETLTGLAVTAEFIWVFVSETQKRIVSGQLDDLPTLFMAFSFAFAIVLAIYGMFIPNSWRRTGAIAGIAAFVPTIAALALRQYSPDLQPVENFPGVVAPALTITMAFTATLAARVVQKIRRAVATAKQYGQYELVEEIGRGGMGVVYKAKHRMLKRPAAIKLIRTAIAKDPATIAEFEHEVQLSAELTHWNSVLIYDYGRTEAGDFYYAMEHLEGETLLSRIRKEHGLSNEQTVNFISQICDGLNEAHIKGMVHRDIKPANIFLSSNTQPPDLVKILDFGLAAMKSETDRLQKVSGTLAYIAPEQIQQQPVDERADIYALGCVIFECLTAQLLFVGDSANDLLDHHLHRTPSLDRLPDSAANFEGIIAKCIEKNPKQ